MAITIEIIKTETIYQDGIANHRLAKMHITDSVSGNTWSWSRGGLPLTGDVQTLLDAESDKLWLAADSKQKPANVLDNATNRELLKAILGVMLDEINLLRAEHSLQPRTAAQFVSAVKSELQSL